MAIEIQSVAHVNVNCTNLARSVAFYRTHLGLESAAHTAPEDPQDGSGFGLPGRVQWDAHMLCDARGMTGPAVDLLQWKDPKPVGSPYSELSHLGFFRLCLLTSDLEGRYEALRSQGVTCLSEPTELPLGGAGVETVRILCFRDPDGTTLELVDVPGEGDRLAHVNLNCSDIARSAEWYERVLGLRTLGGSTPGRVPGDAFGVDGDVEWDARFLLPEGTTMESSMIIDLLEWKHPAPVGTPYPQGHHLGIYRMAFLVADVHAAREELLRQGVHAPEPVWLDMGPEIPVDGVQALFFHDPDGACLELIETPTVVSP